MLRDHTAEHQNAFFDIIDRGSERAQRRARRRNRWRCWTNGCRGRGAIIPWISTASFRFAEPGMPARSRSRCARPTDFLWQRGPFQLTGGGSGIIETAGIDYILPYWMARYYGVVSPVVGAVGGGAERGRGSAIDRFHLSDRIWPGATQQSGVQPPPLSLGGVTLTVTDSAGTTAPRR